jgi:transposase
MSDVMTVGIDLAKNIFAVHGVDGTGRVVLRRKVTRAKLLEFVARLPRCLIGMAACCGAHEWARRFLPFGHTVKLMSPTFVVPLS